MRKHHLYQFFGRSRQSGAPRIKRAIPLRAHTPESCSRTAHRDPAGLINAYRPVLATEGSRCPSSSDRPWGASLSMIPHSALIP